MVLHSTVTFIVSFVDFGRRLEVYLLDKLTGLDQIGVGSHDGGQTVVRHRSRQQSKNMAKYHSVQLS